MFSEIGKKSDNREIGPIFFLFTPLYISLIHQYILYVHYQHLSISIKYSKVLRSHSVKKMNSFHPIK